MRMIGAQAHCTSQNGNTQRQLVVNGEVPGRYGTMLNPDKPADSSGNPLFITGASFNFGYTKIRGSYPAANPGTRVVSAGDTLASITKSVFGDSTLWYLIADANGLSGDRDLRVGQTLTVPNRVAGAKNSSNSFKPCNPGEVVGNTTPNLPAPPPSSSGGGCGGCGGLGAIIMIVVAVVVTVYTGGAGGAIANFWVGALGSGTAATVATAATAAALGSIASQAVGNVLGTQNQRNQGQVLQTNISLAPSIARAASYQFNSNQRIIKTHPQPQPAAKAVGFAGGFSPVPVRSVLATPMASTWRMKSSYWERIGRMFISGGFSYKSASLVQADNPLLVSPSTSAIVI